MLYKDSVYTYFHDNAKKLIGRHLPKDKKGKGWICPLCGNGSGKTGDGLEYDKAAERKGKRGRFKCFKCDFYGDLIDFTGEEFGITDKREMIEKACEIYGVDKEAFRSNTGFKAKSRPQTLKGTDIKVSNDAKPKESEADKERRKRVIYALEHSGEGQFKAFIGNAANEIENPGRGRQYLRERGIHPDTNPITFGEVKNYQHRYIDGKTGEVKSFIVKNGLLISDNTHGYIIRDMDKSGDEKGKYLKPSLEVYEGTVILPTGLTTVIKQDPNKRNPVTGYPEPVFICEGSIDSPSFFEGAGDAIGLNGTASAFDVIVGFEYFGINRPLVVAMDNDQAGKKANGKIYDELKAAGLEVYELDTQKLYSARKDANDALTENRERFTRIIKNAKIAPRLEFEKTLNRGKRESVKKQLFEKASQPGIKTGFETLDGHRFLDGGLYPGLYAIGAISSLGKTTWALQIADQIAKNGKDVIFFSLEMPEIEIIGKSISRYTLEGLFEEGSLNPGQRAGSNAKTLYDIYRNYSTESDGRIERAIDRYFRDTGDHLRVIDGFGETSAEDVRKEIERHVDATGRVPVVFIDYLQLLTQPRDIKHAMTDKQVMDTNVFRLKGISRDYQTAVSVISSFNRENYNNPVSMASFKESGAIEYSSDVLIGLEPEYMGIKDLKLREAKKKEYKKREKETGIRSVRAVVLKNRNGIYGNVDLFDYYFKYNCYIEKGQIEEKEDPFDGFN